MIEKSKRKAKRKLKPIRKIEKDKIQAYCKIKMITLIDDRVGVQRVRQR